MIKRCLKYLIVIILFGIFIVSCGNIKDIIGYSPETRTCIIQREGGVDTITGYNRLIYTPYRGGQFHFLLDSSTVHAPVPLGYVNYLEER